VRNQSLSILHIEDDPLWGDAARLVLESLPTPVDYRRGASRAEALRLAGELPPEVVLLDLRLPDGDGFGVAEELASSTGRPRIIVLSARNDDVALWRIMREPRLAGLVWKSGSLREHLPAALTAAQQGHKYLPPEVHAAMRRLRADPQAFFKILSDRELGLLPGLGRGLTDEELAMQVRVSALTVKSHRQHIMAKLGLHRTPDLIYWAIAHGFVEPSAGRASCCEAPSRFSFPVFGGDARLRSAGGADSVAGAEAPFPARPSQPTTPGLPGNNHEYTKYQPER
jgi:two-component system response regulator NreC